MVKAKSDLVTRITESNESYSVFPSKKWTIPVDTNAVTKHMKETIPTELMGLVKDRIEWTFNRDGFDKRSMIILDMIVNNNWERPIYFSSTVDDNDMMGLNAYMQTEGLASRLMPLRIPEAASGWINSDLM